MSFEEFKKMPCQWVLEVLLFWVLMSFLFELGLLNAVQFKY